MHDEVLNSFRKSKSKLRLIISFVITVVLLATITAAVTYQVKYEELDSDAVADKILVLKSERSLILYRNGDTLKAYSIALGRQPIGKKHFQGDQKTPEGTYIIDWRNDKSKYHLSLHISYPNRIDSAFAADRDTIPGGDIMIHGIKNGLGFIGPLHRFCDWTQGCIALTNAEIEELWRAVPNGTHIEIRP